MRIDNYFPGFSVDYDESLNEWSLSANGDSYQPPLKKAGSLKELRQWVNDLEKKEKAAGFKRFEVLLQQGYGGEYYSVATVTSKESDHHYWLNYFDRQGNKRRGKFRTSEFFPVTEANLKNWQELKAIDISLDELREKRKATVNKFKRDET